MPTALAGSHDAKAYGASRGVVGVEIFWAVTMARSHGSAVPLPKVIDSVRRGVAAWPSLTPLRAMASHGVFKA
ncbi:hypothetical protein Tco_0413277 [Tanacetum coccineum]